MIRCYQCRYYREIASRQKRGWCDDDREGRTKVHVNAVDYCDNAKPIEGEKKAS